MNTWTASAANPAASYTQHSNTTLRGAVRHALVTRALLEHLPEHECRVLDVGGGAGHQAVALARAGHQVVLLDPDREMLRLASQSIATEANAVGRRIEMVHGDGESLASCVGGNFDAVLSHGVLMYVEDVTAALGAIVTAARPGGLISVLTKNADSLAMRAGLEGRWSDALALLDEPTEINQLGVSTRAHTVDAVTDVLNQAGASTETWHGVQIFADHHGDKPAGTDFDRVCELEWAVAYRDPYRKIARLFHLIARRQS